MTYTSITSSTQKTTHLPRSVVMVNPQSSMWAVPLIIMGLRITANCTNMILRFRHYIELFRCNSIFPFKPIFSLFVVMDKIILAGRFFIDSRVLSVFFYFFRIFFLIFFTVFFFSLSKLRVISVLLFNVFKISFAVCFVAFRVFVPPAFVRNAFLFFGFHSVYIIKPPQKSNRFQVNYNRMFVEEFHA